MARPTPPYFDFTYGRGKQGKLPAKALSIIQLNLGGGFPHHESFDPKPEAPAEYRGPFGVTKTRGGDVLSLIWIGDHVIQRTLVV